VVENKLRPMARPVTPDLPAAKISVSRCRRETWFSFAVH
jgi:hypothetical protein